MITPRFYLFLLKKGIPTTIFFLLLGMAKMPLNYVIIFMLVLLISVVFTILLTRDIYKRIAHKSDYFRFKFMINERYYQMLKRYGIPILLFFICGIGIMVLPWKDLVKMVFVLIISSVISYGGVVAQYRHFVKGK